MSNKLRARQYSDARGIIAEGFDGNGVLAQGTTVPTDGSAGYSPGCLFIDRDNTTDGLFLYINEGTATSCDFNPYAGGATAAELGRAADTSAKYEVVTTTNVIGADENGKTFFLSLVGGFTSTLPAPALGLEFWFYVKTAPTTAYIITTNAGADIMYGMMLERAGGAGVAGAGRDTFNFVASQAIIGDWVKFVSDGTNWYYHGMVDVAAGNTVAQS